MERCVKTYNGMSVSAHAGTGFRFMSSSDVEFHSTFLTLGIGSELPMLSLNRNVDFLNKNTLNNLHISELFILSRRGRATRASIYEFLFERQRVGGICSTEFSRTSCRKASGVPHIVPAFFPGRGLSASRRHTSWNPAMPVCRRAVTCNRLNTNTTL